jgi:hypothetical protein
VRLDLSQPPNKQIVGGYDCEGVRVTMPKVTTLQPKKIPNNKRKNKAGAGSSGAGSSNGAEDPKGKKSNKGKETTFYADGRVRANDGTVYKSWRSMPMDTRDQRVERCNAAKEYYKG